IPDMLCAQSPLHNRVLRPAPKRCKTHINLLGAVRQHKSAYYTSLSMTAFYVVYFAMKFAPGKSRDNQQSSLPGRVKQRYPVQVPRCATYRPATAGMMKREASFGLRESGRCTSTDLKLCPAGSQPE